MRITIGIIVIIALLSSAGHTSSKYIKGVLDVIRIYYFIVVTILTSGLILIIFIDFITGMVIIVTTADLFLIKIIKIIDVVNLFILIKAIAGSRTKLGICDMDIMAIINKIDFCLI